MESARQDSKSRALTGIRVRFPAPAHTYKAFVSKSANEVRTKLSGFVAAVLLLALAAPAAALDLELIEPCRLLDSRVSVPGQLRPGMVRTQKAWGRCGVPLTAVGLQLTAHVVGTGAGDLALWGWSPWRPNSPSTRVLAWSSAEVHSASTAVPIGSTGLIGLLVAGSGTHVILDVTGYYRTRLPSVPSPSDAH
jgi:hypothetical protein